MNFKTVAKANSVNRTLIPLTACVLTIVCCGGCDPVRTTSQALKVSVVDARSQLPIDGIRVSIKEAFEPDPKFDQEDQREFWDSLPWSSGVTSEKGIAKIDVILTMLDRSRGEVPPPSRDTLTERSYLLRIGQDETNAENPVEIEVVVGAHALVSDRNVSILEIGAPTYIPTPEGP